MRHRVDVRMPEFSVLLLLQDLLSHLSNLRLNQMVALLNRANSSSLSN